MTTFCLGFSAGLMMSSCFALLGRTVLGERDEFHAMRVQILKLGVFGSAVMFLSAIAFQVRGVG